MNIEKRIVLYRLQEDESIKAWIKDFPSICVIGYNLDIMESALYCELHEFLKEKGLNSFFELVFQQQQEHEKWFLCVSYVQENTTQRNMKNLQIQCEEFRKGLDQIQEEIQKELGFAVTDVVVISWGKI